MPHRHINLGYLHEIVGEDHEFIRDLVRKYLTQLPPRVAELERAVSEGELEKAGFAAHTLRSSFRYLGANQLADACQMIEYASKGGDEGRVLFAWGQIDHAFPEVMEELQAILG